MLRIYITPIDKEHPVFFPVPATEAPASVGLSETTAAPGSDAVGPITESSKIVSDTVQQSATTPSENFSTVQATPSSTNLNDQLTCNMSTLDGEATTMGLGAQESSDPSPSVNNENDNNAENGLHRVETASEGSGSGIQPLADGPKQSQGKETMKEQMATWFESKMQIALRKWETFEKVEDPNSIKAKMLRLVSEKSNKKRLLQQVSRPTEQLETLHPSFISPETIRSALLLLTTPQTQSQLKSSMITSAGLVPLTSVATLLPGPNVFLAANLVHLFGSYRSSKGFDALKSLVEEGKMTFQVDPRLDEFYDREGIWEVKRFSAADKWRCLKDAAIKDVAHLIGYQEAEDLMMRYKDEVIEKKIMA